jgi:hypothetical protein
MTLDASVVAWAAIAAVVRARAAECVCPGPTTLARVGTEWPDKLSGDTVVRVVKLGHIQGMGTHRVTFRVRVSSSDAKRAAGAGHVFHSAI